MYVLSHGFLLSSYKAFFNFHTWVFFSCVLTPTGCKCLFIVYDFFLWESSCYKYFLVFHDVTIYCMLDILYPYGRHYGIPLDIILLELVLIDHSLLPFLLVYFFIGGRLCINDVAQQCHITRVCLRPLALFRSLSILFFILDYSSFAILLIFFWSSFFRYESFLVHIHVCLLEWILNDRHLFFGTSLILIFL